MLSFAGLEDAHFTSIVETATNNIPSDVAAAPTYGQVKALVLPAVAASCGSIRIDDGELYPVVVGENRQLLFRDHPLLGVTAVFENYPQSDDVETTPLQAIAKAARYMDGSLPAAKR